MAKVKPSLSTLPRHTEGAEVQIHSFIAAVSRSERSYSRSGLFNPEARGVVTSSVGAWVGPRAGLDV
jgi:hypothetical protein